MPGQEQQRSQVVDELISSRFIFGESIKYINMMLTNARFITDILVRLGIFLILQRLSINIYLFLGITAVAIASIAFLIQYYITQHYEDSIVEVANQSPSVHPTSILYLKDLLFSVDQFLATERNYINTITNFMDIQVFCTFIFLIIHLWTPITTNMMIYTFVSSVIISTYLHQFVWRQTMKKEDINYVERIKNTIKKCNEDVRARTLNLKKDTPFVIIFSETLLYTGLTIAVLFSLPSNFYTLVVTFLTHHLFSAVTPSIIILSIATWYYPKFRQSVMSSLSAVSTTTVLILMGYKYLQLFPIIRNILFFHVGPVFLFKATCVFIGIMTGLLSYRAFKRSNNISLILESANVDFKPETTEDLNRDNVLDLQNKNNSQHIPPCDIIPPENSGPTNV